MTDNWIDKPTCRGEYWMSPFVDGRYISPRIMAVIDYQRTERGLEVQHDFPHDTIPVDTFVIEYYPKAKWMLIPEPELPKHMMICEKAETCGIDCEDKKPHEKELACDVECDWHGKCKPVQP